MGNQVKYFDSKDDDDVYQRVFDQTMLEQERRLSKEGQSESKGLLLETPGTPDPIRYLEDHNLLEMREEKDGSLSQMDSTETSDGRRLNPTHNYKTFRSYVARLNNLIRANAPFLKATFCVTELHISIVLSDNILPKILRKRLFTTKVARASVIVQYTILPEKEAIKGQKQQSLVEECEDMDLGEFVRLRKFRTVQRFVASTHRLDEVLENIESFCQEARRLNQELNLQHQIADQCTEHKATTAQEQEEESKESTSQLLISPDDKPNNLHKTGRTWKNLNDDLNLCCICLDKKVEIVLPCYHAYCQDCIDDWRSREPTCPMCRQRNSLGSGFNFGILENEVATREEIRLDLIKKLTDIISELIGEPVSFVTTEGPRNDDKSL